LQGQDRRDPMTTTIMIDGHNLSFAKGTGVATYARNISYEIHGLGHRVDVLYGKRPWPVGGSAEEREVSFFDPNKTRHHSVAGEMVWIMNLIRDGYAAPIGMKAAQVPITGYVAREQLKARLPYFDRIWNAPGLYNVSGAIFEGLRTFTTVRGLETPAIMHWTYPLPVRVPGARNIYTLHDLVPLRLPFTTLDYKSRYLAMVQKIVKTADHVVTISEASKRDIIELLGCPEEKISITYQSVTLPRETTDVPEDVARREVEGIFGLTWKGYFLFAGSLEPKKNVGRLIEAHLASGVSTPLVMVGAIAWRAAEELELLGDFAEPDADSPAKIMAYGGRIQRVRYVPLRLLVSLIRGAKGVTFPSIYEGFGLPVLEAMTLGAPVITSGIGATAEVAGDAALLVDPYDPRSIAQAIRTLDADPALAADLSSRGLKQADRFSPARYRERLGAMYDRILAVPPRA
jgi:glycosyltransferase involved in cell wall biosynthesis